MINDIQFSLIIPTYERPEYLIRCVDGALASAHRAGLTNFELIVTDDGRIDPARTYIENKGGVCQWMAGPRRGPGQNRNHGAHHARGRWLIFVDDDCIPSDEWLGAYMAAIEKNKSARVFEGKTIADRPRERADEVAPVNENGGYLWSCNFCIQRELFNSLGGFDERYLVHNEDMDLAARLRAMSIDFPFIPEAVVVHPWRRRTRKIDGWKPASGYLDDILLFLTLHPSENRNLSWHRLLRMALRYLESDIKTAYRNRNSAGLLVSLEWSFQLMGQALAVGRYQGFRIRPAEKPLVSSLLKSN